MAAPRRRRGPAKVLRAVTTTLLVLLLSSSPLPLSDAAATSPTTPSAAPAPAPTPRRNATIPGGAAKGHHRRGAHDPRATPASESSSWWGRLNLGQKVGLALAAVAIGMQVAFVAFLAARARQASRAARAWERESPARASIGGL